jgi:hypothetical protein
MEMAFCRGVRVSRMKVVPPALLLSCLSVSPDASAMSFVNKLSDVIDEHENATTRASC